MPRTCCSCYDDKEEYPISNDTCMCGCVYLNGWAAVLSVQLLAFIGMLFSVATLGDCSFMELENRLFFPLDMDENLPLKVTQTQSVGFLTWKMLDGSCYFYFDGSDKRGQLEEFQDILGKNWEVARLVAMLSACLSFVFFCYLLSFTCSSQVRGVRYFNTVFLSVVLTGLQGITFLSFDSSFCEEYGCIFSRSAGFSVASMACFFLSGLCFFCTTDYPGPLLNKKKPRLVAVAQVAPEQTRSSFGQRKSFKPEGRASYNMYSERVIEEVEEVMPDYEDEVLEEVEESGEEELYDESGHEEILVDDEEEVIDESGTEEILDDQGELIEEEIVEDEDGEVIEDEQIVDDSKEFVNGPALTAGEDREVFTEVTEDSVKVVETITHKDGSQTVTETHKEADQDENRAVV